MWCTLSACGHGEVHVIVHYLQGPYILPRDLWRPVGASERRVGLLGGEVLISPAPPGHLPPDLATDCMQNGTELSTREVAQLVALESSVPAFCILALYANDHADDPAERARIHSVLRVVASEEAHFTLLGGDPSQHATLLEALVADPRGAAAVDAATEMPVVQDLLFKYDSAGMVWQGVG